MKLQSYAAGQWLTGEGAETMCHAITGEPFAAVSSRGLDLKAMLDYGRRVGGPVLRKLTFHERALRLKSLAQYLMERKESYYEISRATSATRSDSWVDIEGGIMTLSAYSSKAERNFPTDDRCYQKLAASSGASMRAVEPLTSVEADRPRISGQQVLNRSSR